MSKKHENTSINVQSALPGLRIAQATIYVLYGTNVYGRQDGRALGCDGARRYWTLDPGKTLIFASTALGA